jgi:hypothetical protein
MDISRRQTLKGLGLTGIIGGVGLSMMGSASAAASTGFSAVNPAVVSNDTGDISEVYVAPDVYTQWKNFDEVPLKLRYILEAGIEGQGYKPVYRETPWLFTDSTSEQTAKDTAQVGTTDRVPDSGLANLLSKNSDFYNLNSNDDPTSTPKIMLFKEGQSNYYDEPSDYDGHSGGSGQDHWTGASLGADSGAYANGNYGVLGNTDALDSATDGQSKQTTIKLRLTSVLLNYDSESVMQAEYPAYSGSAGYTYQRLRNIESDHPAVNVETAQFTVTAKNEQSSSSSGGNANPGAS